MRCADDGLALLPLQSLLLMQPGILFLPHGNLQYSQLRPEKRGWVVRESYGALFDLSERHDAPLAFEASGETLEIMAAAAPTGLDQLPASLPEVRIQRG